MFGPIDFSPVIYIQIFSRNAVAVYKKKENNVPPNAGEVAKAFDIPLFLFFRPDETDFVKNFNKT